MARYYDYVLAFIPLALVGGVVALSLIGAGEHLAIAGAGVASGALVGHAVFVRYPRATAPQDDTDESNRSPSSGAQPGAD